jgi:hypothetical protein
VQLRPERVHLLTAWLKLWIPEIDNASNNITIPINQPAGLSYLVTVWGASGIEFAGTTDVQSESSP